MKDNVIHRYTGKLGGDQIGLNGHLYTHDRVVTSASGLKKRYWQCSMKKKLKCTAGRLITSNDEPLTVLKEPTHNHQCGLVELQVAKVKTVIRNTALHSAPTGTVVRQACLGVDPATFTILPDGENLKRKVRLLRRQANLHPVNPKSAGALVIPKRYKVDCLNRRFLLAGLLIL